MASGIMDETKTATEKTQRSNEAEKPVQSGEPMCIEPDPSSQQSAPDKPQSAVVEAGASLQGESGEQTGGDPVIESDSKRQVESPDTEEITSPMEEEIPSPIGENTQEGANKEDRSKEDTDSQPEPMEESKTLEVLVETQDPKVHHPMKEGRCFTDGFVTVGADGKKKVNVEPLKLEIKRLRRAEKSWTEVLALVFGYRYDRDWNLKKLDSDEGFIFLDQKHYELLGDVILNYVQEVMRVEYHLRELWIPEGTQEPKCNIFHSPDFFTNDKFCLLLIQGAGAVRAGQWARSVCINAKLTEGTVFPALDYARTQGFSTIVFNPNYNSEPETRKTISGSGSMEEHARFVWKNYIRKCPAANLYIIAHSCGGMCTASLLENFESDFVERVKAVAFTDSVHGGVRCSKRGKTHLASISVDFVASGRPLKSFVCSARDSYNGSIHVSSGHHKHEYTTGSAMPAIVEFFEGMRINGRNLFL